MVLDLDGCLVAANNAARALGRRLGAPLDDVTGADRLLAAAQLVNGGGAPPWVARSAAGGLDALVSVAEAPAGEMFELVSAVRRDAEGQPMGWVVRLIEITPLMAALRGQAAAAGQRDQMLKLMSHDMRTPLAAILVTLKHPDLGVMPANLRQIIEGAARRALNMVDSNVRLIRAQSADYKFVELDFRHVLEEVIDTSWSLSKEVGVKIVLPPGGGELSILADRGSLTDALTDLFGRLLRGSARGGVLLCDFGVTSAPGGASVTLDIKDAVGDGGARGQAQAPPGPAIPSGSNRVEDSGGLDFFRTVINRHGGTAVWESEPGGGRSVSITIPGVGPGAPGL